MFFNILLSLDNPFSGSGDHENYFYIDSKNFSAYDENGKRYSYCTKKAVDIRDIEIHRPWYSFGDNSLFFSDLANHRFIELTEENMDKALINQALLLEAKNSIRYTKAVNSTYGYVIFFNNQSNLQLQAFIVLTSVMKS